MKTFIKNLCLLPVLIAGLRLLLVGQASAQTFTTLHSFAAGAYNPSGFLINSDGAEPNGGLILSGKTLYGTAGQGGSSANGTVFALNTDGTGFTNLHTFSANGNYTNSDGAYPSVGLFLSGNTLYGTSISGGSSGNGTVFAISTNGTGLTTLHSFAAYTNSDGADARGLILSGNTLYGITSWGGTNANGTVFKLSTDGTGFMTLHGFSTIVSHTNNDGAHPYGSLILSGNTLYGTTQNGGSSGSGTLFAVNIGGMGFTNLYNFSALSDTSGTGTNGDGAQSNGALVLSGNTLYGTSISGGGSGNGTVFAISTNGTGFTNLHSFTATPAPSYTNSDGAHPLAGLILSGKTLYGTAGSGGSSDNGTVFAVNSDGTGFINLHNFPVMDSNGFNSDGAVPYGGLILSGNTLYGTAGQGGRWGNGTVFSISLPVPRLTIVLSGTNVILSWPTDAAGFDYNAYILQTTTNLGSPVWTTNSPAPAIVNGQNTVTNPTPGTRKFFRLIQ